MGFACPVHDTIEREWQHLNFFEHHCFLHCAVPRITTSAGKVTTVEVPWARPGSGFTLLFEAFAMALIEREMPVCASPRCWASIPSGSGICSATG